MSRRNVGLAISAAVMWAATSAGAADTTLDERLSRLEGSSANTTQPTDVVAGATATSSASTSASAPAQASTQANAADAPPKKMRGSSKPSSTRSQPRALTIEERLSRLEAASAAATAAAATPAPAPEAKPASASTATVEFNNLRPVIKSADGRNEMAIRATVQFDAASYMQHAGDIGPAVTADQRDLGSGAVFRRVRFGVEGKFLQDFFYELRFDFGGTDADGSGVLDIARVGAFIAPGLRIQAGAIQPVFTLADATASSELTLMERPAIGTTLVPVFGGEPGRRGAEIAYQHTDLLDKGDNLILSGAFTGQKVTNGHSGSSLDDEGTQVLGRLAYRFYSDDNTNLQIGTSAAEIVSISGTTPDGARNLRFRDRAESRVSGERLIDTGNIPAEDASMYGFEAAGNYKNFYVAGEWYTADVTRDRDCSGCVALAGDPNFSGWYVEGSWVLTGEPRRYTASGNGASIGVWSSPKPKAMVGDGGWGALEAMARYSVDDLDWNAGSAGHATPVGGIRGGKQSIFSLGLNWYLNTNLRVMTDFEWVNVDRLDSAGADAGQDFQILQSRAQFAF